MSTSLTAAQPFVFARGDTWPMLVDYLDPTTGLPIDTAGSVVTGQLDLARNVRPIALTVANGGLTIDPVTKRMRFVATPTVTSSIAPDPVALGAVPATYAYPNRLIIIVQDSFGAVITRGIFPVLVFDARNVPIGSIPQGQAVTMTTPGPQGPAGATVSVNGHTGPVQTVTAADVGAYTTTQVDAAIATATATLQAEIDGLRALITAIRYPETLAGTSAPRATVTGALVARRALAGSDAAKATDSATPATTVPVGGTSAPHATDSFGGSTSGGSGNPLFFSGLLTPGGGVATPTIATRSVNASEAAKATDGGAVSIVAHLGGASAAKATDTGAMTLTATKQSPLFFTGLLAAA